MKEITFKVEPPYVASWNAPGGKGSITIQGRSLRELSENIIEAVFCHFDDGKAPNAPRRIRIHFSEDIILDALPPMPLGLFPEQPK
jgi:hypothetical protein